jgi:RhtB (resistance to homoserine/threonine) family protein
VDFYQTLMVILVVQVIAVAVPGPDFFCVTQASILHGKRAGFVAALGISAGLIVHIAAGIFGVVALMANPTAMWIMKVLCGSYLLYLGVQGLRSKPSTGEVATDVHVKSQWAMFQTGFLCNVLNPKVPMYFLSLFTVIIPPNTPITSLLIIGLLMIVITALWFGLVAFVFSNSYVQHQFRRLGHWLDRVVGVLFFGFGVKVLLSSQTA